MQLRSNSNRVIQAKWIRMAGLIAAVLAIAVCQELAADPSPGQHVFTRLYYLPVLIAAIYDGWRGGVFLALIATGAVFQHLLGVHPFGASAPVQYYLEPVSFLVIALLTGLYTDRERREKRRCQQLAEELSDVYGKLQTNFEGMKRAERLSAIGQLSAGLAHEIRNPLASIAGAASILQRSGRADAKSSKCLDIIESECKRLNGLLTTFLNFARPRAPHLQSVSVEAILDGVLALAQHAIGRKSINFRRHLIAGMPSIDCDPEQMTQVLLNLVINATEASEAGATVTLMADQSDDTVRIRVSDEGCGVPPEDIDKLFNPFFTTKESGTGLGLPVAHQIVGQMGGLLTAHRNPSGGMTFSIELPLKQAQKAS
jgi:two-component system, NtrC family, sensor histidine kinase HydH